MSIVPGSYYRHLPNGEKVMALEQNEGGTDNWLAKTWRFYRTGLPALEHATFSTTPANVEPWEPAAREDASPSSGGVCSLGENEVLYFAARADGSLAWGPDGVTLQPGENLEIRYVGCNWQSASVGNGDAWRVRRVAVGKRVGFGVPFSPDDKVSVEASRDPPGTKERQWHPLGSSARAGKTRRTMKALTDLVKKALWDIVEGKTDPTVFWYVGAGRSVRITVEVDEIK